MKRDWEVVRDVLCRVEALGINDVLRIADFDEGVQAIVSYNVDLLIDAGLLQGDMSRAIGPGPYDFLVRGMTWEGHELYDAIKDDTVWKKTKSLIGKVGGATTVEVLKSLAQKAAMSIIIS